VSVTGIAGPGGATPEKPVGLTWIALSADHVDEAWQFNWSGNRLSIKQQSAQSVLQMLIEYLNGL